MTKTEAVETIHANWPPEHYSMLREALTIAVSHLEQSSNSEYVETNGTDWICEKCGQYVELEKQRDELLQFVEWVLAETDRQRNGEGGDLRTMKHMAEELLIRIKGDE